MFFFKQKFAEAGESHPGSFLLGDVPSPGLRCFHFPSSPPSVLLRLRAPHCRTRFLTNHEILPDASVKPFF